MDYHTKFVCCWSNVDEMHVINLPGRLSNFCLWMLFSVKDRWIFSTIKVYLEARRIGIHSWVLG